MTADVQPATTSKLKKLLRAPTRTELLGVSGASLVFLVGWFAEEGLSWVKATYWPDDYQARAEAVREELSAKSDAIRDLTDRMAEDLAGLKGGSADGAALEAFLAKAEQLMQRTDELKPTVASAADFSGEMAEVHASVKANEIARLGYSSKADLTMVPGQSLVLCAERFVFSFHSFNSFTDTIRGRTSFKDRSNAFTNISSGNPVIIEGQRFKAIMTFVGLLGEGEERTYGFNMECAPLSPGEAA